MQKDYLILKPASASRPSGEWNDDDFDMLANGEVVGRILKVNAAPVGSPWMWALAFGYRRDRAPNHGMQQRARPPWLRLPRAGGGYHKIGLPIVRARPTRTAPICSRARRAARLS
jgi:hypothetical protein